MASTPTLDRFLVEISRILREKNGAQLQDYLVIEPPYADLYNAMIAELRRAYGKNQQDALEKKCTAALPEARDGEDGASWTAFIKFITQYFCFIRDVNIKNLLDTYNLLAEVVQKCNSALGHPSLGILILPTVITYSRMLSRLAIGLDKQPELIAEFTKQSTDESGARETLPERAANYVRQAFVTCLNDRSVSFNGVKDGKPDGRKVGIYKLANLCLKILFQCRKTRNAEQIFTNIYNQSPPLSIYPRAERVTYLYYLGRFLFSNNHFYRAQLALQTAFHQCHAKAAKQRRLILIYLVTTNIILGRFPSKFLYQLPEAHGLGEKFQPVCIAISKGDLATFRQITADGTPLANWMMHYRILLQIRDRCEVLVWRSLLRKTFLLNGSQGDAEAKKAPTLELSDVLKLLQFLEKRAAGASNTTNPMRARHTNWIFMNNAEQKDEGYIDPDLLDAEELTNETMAPDMLEVECIVSSLIEQGLLGGYIAHRLLRFAIQGSQRKGGGTTGALAAGFPNVWETIKSRADDEVPGWKRDSNLAVNGSQQSYGPGMVVNLSGLRPAGAGP